jgi:hypothetical protein
MISTGTVAIVAAAERGAHSVPDSIPIKEYIATSKTIYFESVFTINGHINAFQLPRKTNKAKAKRVGFIIGIAIEKKYLPIPQPST